jgi:hypothetical protein
MGEGGKTTSFLVAAKVVKCGKRTGGFSYSPIETYSRVLYGYRAGFPLPAGK